MSWPVRDKNTYQTKCLLFMNLQRAEIFHGTLGASFTDDKKAWITMHFMADLSPTDRT